MANPVLTKSLTQLRTDFNNSFPGRDKGTDGWIGDEAHQQETSGHNPDDTPGVKAEYSDSDSKPEVRAIDVDKDLRDSVYTMYKVIEQILKNKNDTKRLAYIIFNGTIWSASHSWQPHEYTGSNLHDQHAHFSGDPDYDEDATTWSIGDGMSYTEGQMRAFPWQYEDPNEPTAHRIMLDPEGDLRTGLRTVAQLESDVKALQADVTAIKDMLSADDTGGGGGGILPDNSQEILDAVAAVQRTVDGLVNGVKANAANVSAPTS